MGMMFSNHAFFFWLFAASLSLAILWLVYTFLFQSWTLFAINRWIIIGGTSVCLILPFVSSDLASTLFVSESVASSIRLNLPAFGELNSASNYAAASPTNAWNLPELFWLFMMLIYWSGVLVMVIRLFKALRQIHSIRSGADLLESNATAKVWVQRRLPTFSFGKEIFLNFHALSLASDQLASVRCHEEAHVLQKHSADNIFFEIVSAIFWFNPFVRKLSKHLHDVHEYLADQWVAGAHHQVNAYQNLLVKLASGVSANPITHPFSDSQFFRRIVMLDKPRTKTMERLKLFLLIPSCVAAIFLSACVDIEQRALANPRSASTDSSAGPVISKITWKGNIVHSDSELNKLLGAKPGDNYDRQKFEALLFRGPLDESVTSLYMDNGYLFFRTEIAEKFIEDKVELTLQVSEDEQVWINNVILKEKNGITGLASKVRSLLDVKKGQLFNRSLLLSSQEKLAKSGFVRPDSIWINPYPLARVAGERKYLDIEFLVQNP